MNDLVKLSVAEASALLADRKVSARELLDAYLDVIAADGAATFDGRPDAINAWVRLYEEDAIEAADRADERLARGNAPELCGIPIGLKDLYGVAGKPVTASSRAVKQVPDVHCDFWRALEPHGLVLVGHLHTHECAAGGSTDQVGNPWALDRSPGGSSGGSAAALVSHQIALASGSDTAGSLRIPSALCGTSTIKPTRGALSTRGIFPLSGSLDHPGPMARSLEGCAMAMRALAGAPLSSSPLSADGTRVALSPRLGLVDTEDDVKAGFARAVEALGDLGAEVVEPPPPDAPLDLGMQFVDLLSTDMLGHHNAFGTDRSLLRPATRELLEYAEKRAMSGAEYADLQYRRAAHAAAWGDWLEEYEIEAVVEPTVPITAPLRGHGYDTAFSAEAGAYIAFTSYWDWMGFPVVSLPAGLGESSGLPVGVSLIGAPASDWPLLDRGIELQVALGVPALPL